MWVCKKCNVGVPAGVLRCPKCDSCVDEQKSVITPTKKKSKKR